MIAEYPGPRPIDRNITCGHSKLTGHNKMLPDGVVGPYDTRLWEILTSREEAPGKLRPTGATDRHQRRGSNHSYVREQRLQRQTTLSLTCGFQKQSR